MTCEKDNTCAFYTIIIISVHFVYFIVFECSIYALVAQGFV